MLHDVEIIPLEDRERWTRAQRDGGLPGQAWGYAQALEATGIQPQLAVVRAGGARMLLPFFERVWRDHRDIATLMGLSGASISPPSTAPLALWAEFATAQGWVTGYLHLGEGIPADIESCGRVLARQQLFHLELGVEEPLAVASAIIRRKVRAAARAGTVLVESPEEVTQALLRLYRLAGWRHSASSAYAFPETTLRRWAMDPGCLALAARVNGKVEAVSLFGVAGSRADYYLNAASDRGRVLSAWLIQAAIHRLRARGVKRLNLGGGLTPGDSLHEFKARFHGSTHAACSIGQVYAPDRHALLCADAGVDADAGTWFPAYRTAPDTA